MSKITPFDVSEYLENDKMIAEYLNAIIEEDDPALLLSAIGDIAKARGMSKIASESGLGRESLYKALSSDAKPRFDTILRVLRALGVKVAFNIQPSRHVSRRNHRKRGALHGISKAMQH